MGVVLLSLCHRGRGCFPAAPYWLDEPENLILAPGEDGRLVCRANGNPKPSIQWLVNGEPIEGERGREWASFSKIPAQIPAQIPTKNILVEHKPELLHSPVSQSKSQPKSPG